MNIRNRETQTESYRNQTVDGILVKAYLINPSGTPVTTDIDFEQSTIKVVLNRGGVQDIIVQDDLKKLGLASTVDSLLQYAFSTGNTTINSNLGSLIMFKIPFGGHINLKNDDFIWVEVTNLNGLFGASIAATSYLDIKLTKSVGYETHIPMISSRVIQASESSRKFDLGDNVKRVAILNYDKTDFLNNVIDNITISSDRYNENLNFGDLVYGKVARYPNQLLVPVGNDLSVQMQEDQSFILMDFHQHFNGVELDIKFQSTQVLQGKNVIVFWTYRTDMTIINKAAALETKHTEKAVAMVVDATKKK